MSKRYNDLVADFLDQYKIIKIDQLLHELDHLKSLGQKDFEYFLKLNRFLKIRLMQKMNEHDLKKLEFILNDKKDLDPSLVYIASFLAHVEKLKIVKSDTLWVTRDGIWSKKLYGEENHNILEKVYESSDLNTIIETIESDISAAIERVSFKYIIMTIQEVESFIGLQFNLPYLI